MYLLATIHFVTDTEAHRQSETDRRQYHAKCL